MKKIISINSDSLFLNTFPKSSWEISFNICDFLTTKELDTLSRTCKDLNDHLWEYVKSWFWSKVTEFSFFYGLHRSLVENKKKVSFSQLIFMKQALETQTKGHQELSGIFKIF